MQTIDWRATWCITHSMLLLHKKLAVKCLQS